MSRKSNEDRRDLPPPVRGRPRPSPDAGPTCGRGCWRRRWPCCVCAAALPERIERRAGRRLAGGHALDRAGVRVAAGHRRGGGVPSGSAGPTRPSGARGLALVAAVCAAGQAAPDRPSTCSGSGSAWGWLLLCGSSSRPARGPSRGRRHDRPGGGAVDSTGCTNSPYELPALGPLTQKNPDDMLRGRRTVVSARLARCAAFENRLANSEPLATFALTNSLAGYWRLAVWSCVGIGCRWGTSLAVGSLAAFAAVRLVVPPSASY